MRFTFRLLAAVVAVVGVAGTSQAVDITVDNFTSPAVAAIANSVSNQTGFSGAGHTASYSLTTTPRTIGFSPALAGLDVSSVGAGVFATNFENGITASINYAFSAPQDLTGLDRILFDFLRLDPGTGLGGSAPDLPFSVILTSAGGSAEFKGSLLANPNPFTDFADYSLFTTVGAFNLSQVTGLRIVFNDDLADVQSGVDFRLTRVYFRGDGGGIFGDPEVPEPASMVVFGVLALGGAFVARRKLLAKKVAA
jgi:hypothetical protein